MKFRVICWGTEDRIVFNNTQGRLKNICDNNVPYKQEQTFYYQLEDNKAKVITTNINKVNFYNKYLNTSTYNNVDSIIISEINNNNLAIIKEANKKNKYLIIVGKVNLSKDIIDSNNEVLNKVICIPQLSDEKEKLEIKAILFMILDIYNNELFNMNTFLGVYVIIGCEKGRNILGKIPLFILKRFNYICKMKKFTLNLHIDKELDLQELTYIEDPLIEYMNEDSMLIIKQSISNNKNEKMYFSIIAT